MAQGEAPSRRARSHEQIVRVASRMIREQGLEGAPVDEVMAAAGLTRGGFYAHFPDKTEMIVEALDLAFAQAKSNLFCGDVPDGDAWLAKANARYLSEAHVEGAGNGCALPALGGQIPRSPQRVRDTFARNIDDVLALVASKLAGGEPSDADRREATRILAQWVGALTLARTFTGARSAEILEIGRAAVAERSPRKRPAQRDAAQAPAPSTAKSSRAVSPKTRARAASPKPAPSKAWSSRSQA
jgi:TetR/AcrR family transcriptional repressor of nem operon